ncbi:MAG: hypothetical protein ACSLE5_10730 [Porticoccaceae bacterium]
MSETVARKSATQIWMILAITASVLLGAFLVVPRSEEQRQWLLSILGTSNKGILLKPATTLSSLDLKDEDGKLWPLTAQKPRWRLLIPVADGCAEACRDALYLTRQVHMRLEKNAHRLERILLNLGPALNADILAFLKKEHPHLAVLSADQSAFQATLASTNGVWSPAVNYTYVVDQAGVAMLYFTAEHSGGDMLADLRHLMKYSPEP